MDESNLAKKIRARSATLIQIVSYIKGTVSREKLFSRDLGVMD